MAYMRLKRSIEVVASAVAGVNFRDLRRDRDLDSFLLLASESNWSVLELAARALHELTVGSKESLFDRVITLAVLRFLDEEFGAPNADAGGQRFADLADILESSHTFDAFFEWAKSWYN